MADETKQTPENDSDVLSDDELDAIAGGHGGRPAQHPQPGKQPERKKDERT